MLAVIAAQLPSGSDTSDPSTLVTNLTGALTISVVVAAIAARIVLALYRRRVLANMAGPEPAADEPGTPPASPEQRLQVVVVPAEAAPSGPAAVLADVMRAANAHGARINAIAGGLVCLLVATVLVSAGRGFAGSMLAWLVASVTMGGFVVVTTALVALPERWQVVVAPVVWLVVVLAGSPFVMRPGSGAFGLFALAAVAVGLPTVLGVLIAGPSSRAAAPILFVPLVVGLTGTFIGIQSGSDRMDAAPDTVTLSEVFVRIGIGAAAGIALAGLGLSLLVHRYARKDISDRQILLATWWFCFLSVSAVTLSPALGSGVLLAAPAWVMYVVVARWLVARRGPRTDRAHSLLVLRVFRARRRLEAVMRGVELYWRHVGPIHLIAGPDLASRFVDPPNLVGFLRWRLRERFLSSREEVDARVQTVDEAPDADGRYRVNEFFCTGSSWQYCVSRLISKVDVILADFRGFKPENRGSAFELRTLIDRVPLDRLVCLVDGESDVQALTDVAETHWPKVARDSPNRRAPSPTLTLARMERGRAVDAKALLARLSMAATG